MDSQLDIMKHSTFVRKTRKQFHPNGTKPSVHTGQLLVSSGLHDLDGNSHIQF